MRRLPLLFLVLAACGDDSARKIADAPAGPHDSPPLIDSPPQMLQVVATVTNADGSAVAGVHVYFQNADSSVVGETMLDASGNARQLMNAGGYVTALVPAPPPPGFGLSVGYYVFTWAGVKPGDHLLLSPPSSPNADISATVTIPLDSANAATITQYVVQSTCSYAATAGPPTGSGATNTALNVSFFDGCSAADMFVLALDSGNQVVSSFEIPAQPVTANEMIDYTAQTYTAAVARAYSLTNNPNPTDTISINDQYFTGRGIVYAGTATNLASEDPATGTAQMPAPPAGALDVIEATQHDASTKRTVIEWGTSGAYSQDWGTHLLPDFATAPSLDTGTHVMGWTTTGGTATPDYALVGLDLYRSSTNAQWQWGIAVPTGTQAAFPNLPTDVVDVNVAADDSVFTADVRMVKVPGGYDAVRGNVFQTTTPVPTGATGIAALSEYQPLLGVTAKQKAHAKHDVMRRWIRPR
jgi:hypothetical protein